MKKSLYIKILVVCILAIVVLSAWIYDAIRVKEYDMNIVYVSDTTPYADSKDLVTIKVLVTRNGQPCEGHEVEARLPDGNGDFNVGKVSALQVTDKEGIATFTYKPYKESDEMQAGPVNMLFLDLSNSLIVEVNLIKEFQVVEVISMGR